MKKLIIAKLLIFSSFCVSSQISMLRYNDNFSYLKKDSISPKGSEKLKHIGIFENVNISFGGEVREQFQYYKNRNFGDVPKLADPEMSQVWHRAMAHSNLELGKSVRLFAQLGSTFRFFNANPITPEIDENKLSVHQAFLDYYFDIKNSVRLGRQEITYGNNRLLTFREGPNTRLAFDAFIFKHYSKKRKYDVFALTPVLSRPGIFDDQSFFDLILGAYSTEQITPGKLYMDLYFINFSSNRRSYNYLSGNENRQSYGFRLFSQKERFNYEVEATYQSGRFNQLGIRAYSLSSDLTYKVYPSFGVTLGLATNYASGDKDDADKQLNTYNFLFSKPQFGLTAAVGSTNIANINPYLRLVPNKRTNLLLGSFFMWRQSNKDGTYTPLATEIRPTSTLLFKSTKNSIGTQLAFESSYSISRNFLISLDAAYFFAGEYVKESGKGEDIRYISLKASLKF